MDDHDLVKLVQQIMDDHNLVKLVQQITDDLVKLPSLECRICCFDDCIILLPELPFMGSSYFPCYISYLATLSIGLRPEYSGSSPAFVT